MNKLTNAELEELLLSTNTIEEGTPEIEKQAWRNSYRKVEEENINMIKYYGGVEAWYVSGQGRCF